MTLTPRTGALVLAWAFGLYGALGGLPRHPAHELHLVLGAHYQADLFSLWTTRWDHGQSVTGHSPLLHLVLGLLARLPHLGVERAWAVLTSLGPPLLAWGAGRFVEKAARSRRAGDSAAWVAAANPLLLTFVFPYAQLPFVVGCTLALLAGSEWLSLARGTSWAALLSSSALALSALTAHHASVVLLGAVGLIALLLPGLRVRWLPALAASALGSALAARLVLSPLFESAAHIHAVAPNKLAEAGALGVLLVTGLTVAAALFALALGPRESRVLAGTSLALLLASKLSLWSELPDDKWVWAAWLAGLLALAITIAARPAERLRVVCLAATVSLLSVGTAWALGSTWKTSYGHRWRSLGEVAALLGEPLFSGRRYVTISLKSARFELARRVPLASLDTGLPWYQASVLNGTPFSSIDELPLASAEAKERLRSVLGAAPEHHLAVVVSADSRASPLLQAEGFVSKGAWPGGLTVWTREGVASETPDPRPVLTSWLWALGPLGAAGLGGLLLSWPRLRRRRSDEPRLS